MGSFLSSRAKKGLIPGGRHGHSGAPLDAAGIRHIQGIIGSLLTVFVSSTAAGLVQDKSY